VPVAPNTLAISLAREGFTAIINSFLRLTLFFDRKYQIKAESNEIGIGWQNCGEMNVEMCLVEKII